MDFNELVEQAERNITQAVDDYRAHTDKTDVLDDISGTFINTLAHDSTRAKQDLRELFKKSPVYDEKLDALVINGTRTHNPDYSRIRDLATDILSRSLKPVEWSDVCQAIEFFSNPNLDDEHKEKYISVIKRIAPKAYTPTKKLSRVFKGICDALEVTDDTAGSRFQRLYAQFADELTSKKIGFKLFVSINPAHFLTMSNPKYDERGNTLTSCHSLNSTEYEYNNGCSGYARDKVSFIVFTVADPSDAETLNNRKTTRQIFAYRPGSGLLLQSRMYNTSGGVYGAAEDSKLYRDLVQREISMLEGVPNLWKTTSSYGDRSYLVSRNIRFGGYPDWVYDNFDGHISTRADCDADNVPALEIGDAGLCIKCGVEISSGLYCEDCSAGDYVCAWCRNNCDETHTVYNRRGEQIEVCDDCFENDFIMCDYCEEYYPNDDVTCVRGGDYICGDCLDEHYTKCDKCDEYVSNEDSYDARDENGHCIDICDSCRDNSFCTCSKCEELWPEMSFNQVYEADGEDTIVCNECFDGYEKCPHCGEYVDRCSDGTCPNCGAVIEEEEEKKNA